MKPTNSTTFQSCFVNQTLARPSSREISKPESERVISNQDGRKQITDTNKWPYSCIGVVFTKWKDGSVSWGTGTLISPKAILTCAHNICRIKEEKLKIKEVIKPLTENVEFMLGAIGYNHSIICQVDQIFLPEDYEKTANSNEDFAILILKEDIGYERGWMGLHSSFQTEINLSQNFLNNRKLSLYGYPSDKVSDKPKCYEMWGMEGTLGTDGNLMYYKQIDTYSGQSGSPLFYEDTNSNYYIVGVHSKANSDYNSGILFKRERFKLAEQWMLETNEYKERLDPSGNMIDLSFNNLIGYGIEYLVSFDLSQIQKLDLFNNKIEEEGMKHLANSNLNNLKELNLNNNKIRDNGLEILFKPGSKCNFINLNILNLQNNEITDSGVKFLPNGRLKNLHTLNLSYNNINSVGAKYLSNLEAIQKLYLSNNNIAVQGSYEFAYGKCKKIRCLDLSDNKIGNSGAEFLSEGKFTNLTQLILRNNNIGDSGAKYLSKLNNLEVLNLSLNKIGDQGAKYLSQMNITKKLDLQNNNFGDEGKEFFRYKKFLGNNIMF